AARAGQRALGVVGAAAARLGRRVAHPGPAVDSFEALDAVAGPEVAARPRPSAFVVGAARDPPVGEGAYASVVGDHARWVTEAGVVAVFVTRSDERQQRHGAEEGAADRHCEPHEAIGEPSSAPPSAGRTSKLPLSRCY